MNINNIHNAIQQATSSLNQLKAIYSIDRSYIDFLIPICWFGDISDESKPLILTLGINPSTREFPLRSNRFKCLLGTTMSSQSLYDDYNGYFHYNPYRLWFDTQEKYLRQCGLDASYYSQLNTKYRLVHIDITPFATNPTWSRFNRQCKNQSLNNDMINAGLKLIKVLIEECNPKLILSFGGFNEKMSVFINNPGSGFKYTCTQQLCAFPPKKLGSGGKRPRKFEVGELVCAASNMKVPIISSTLVFNDWARIFMPDDHVKEILKTAKSKRWI